MQEFSQRVCQYVEAFENEQKKKYKMSLQKTEASAGTAHILFEESQLQLMFYVFEVAIVVPLFSFFFVKVFFYMYYSSFCTLPFQRGASSEFPGVLRRSPPTVTVMFLAFYTDIESSRVEPVLHGWQHCLQTRMYRFKSCIALDTHQ